MPPVHKYIETIRNPWTTDLSGPADEFSLPTGTVKLRSIHNVSVGTANTGVALGFQPWALPSFTNGYTITAGTNTVTGTTAYVAHPDATSFQTYYSRYRSISTGFKVFYVGAEQTTAGVISVIPLLSTGTINTELPGDLEAMSNLPEAKTVAAASMTGPLCCALSSFDRPRFHLYTDTTGVQFFPSIVITAIGCAVGACLRIEVEHNLEVLPKLTSSLQGNNVSVVQPDTDVMNIARRLDPVRVGSEQKVTQLGGLTRAISQQRTIGKRKRGYTGSTMKRSKRPMLFSAKPSGRLFLPPNYKRAAYKSIARAYPRSFKGKVYAGHMRN